MYYLVMRPAREAVAMTVSLERQLSAKNHLPGGDVQPGISRMASSGGLLRRATSGLPRKRLFAKYEPLLEENEDRYVLFPIKYHDIWNMYKQSIALLWSADELEYAADASAFVQLQPAEQRMIKQVLAFF